jgi:hypothetical protein
MTLSSIPRAVLLVVLISFSILTAIALWHHGYWGILEPHFKTFGAGQVLADLAIALSLMLVWMWRDAKDKGRSFLPWFVLTLIFGSFGPLLYLITQPSAATSPHKVAA